MQQKVLSSNKIPVLDSLTNKVCDSCLNNKSHKLSTKNSSVHCAKPFQVVYSDVWGLNLVTSFSKF